jgi:hypothetical protein
MGMMVVRAKLLGYYNHVRHYPEDSNHPRAGDTFKLNSPKDFSKKWMEVVEEGSDTVPPPIDNGPQPKQTVATRKSAKAAAKRASDADVV